MCLSLVAVLLSTFVACVPLDQLPPGTLPDVTNTQGASASTFPDIDPGGTSVTTLHFTIKGYSENQIRPIGVTAETLYSKIGNDTGLYSFLASGSYTIVVYQDRDEYLRKTRLPNWSRAVTSGGAIYTYPDADLETNLAHEMTHLLFNSYMKDKAPELRWMNEGLAMYEEIAAVSDSERVTFQRGQITNLRSTKMPFSQMVFFTPITEERRRVDAWYQQVHSVVAFMLAQGSAINFGSMLNAIKNGSDIDAAIANNYPGKFRNFNDVESSWKYTI